MIALGLVTAVFGYFRDRASMDYTSITNASDAAVLHAVLWGIAGVVVILWANGGSGGSSLESDNDEG